MHGLSMEAFLKGPDNEDAALDIHPCFAKRFEHHWDDGWSYRLIPASWTDSQEPWIPMIDGPSTPSDHRPGYRFLEQDHDLLLIDDQGAPVGGYVSCDVSIMESHQGLGLGAELILEYFLRHDDFPTWYLDSPQYTKAGLYAHQAAQRLGNTAVLVEKKQRRLDLL